MKGRVDAVIGLHGCRRSTIVTGEDRGSGRRDGVRDRRGSGLENVAARDGDAHRNRRIHIGGIGQDIRHPTSPNGDLCPGLRNGRHPMSLQIGMAEQTKRQFCRSIVGLRCRLDHASDVGNETSFPFRVGLPQLGMAGCKPNVRAEPILEICCSGVAPSLGNANPERAEAYPLYSVVS